jgi:hypothetical protein
MGHRIKRLSTGIGHHVLRLRAYVSKPLLVKQRFFVPDDGEHCENPIFVLGVHRSGTSLLRRILNSHSQIWCPPESFFLKNFCELYKSPGTRVGLSGFGLNNDDEEYRRQIAAWAARYHEAYRKGCGKKRWADKTPAYIAIASDLAELFGSSAQFVALYRHPFDIVYSIFSRGWKLGAYHQDPLVRAVSYVSDTLKRLADFVDSGTAEVFALRYEDMTAAPRQTLGGLFSFLGVPWEDEVLEFNRQPHNFGTEDPMVRGTRKILARNQGNWQALDEHQIQYLREHLNETARRIGYSEGL